MDFFVHNWASRSKLVAAYSTAVDESSDSLSETRRGLLGRPYRTLSCQWVGISQAEFRRQLLTIMRSADTRLQVPLYMDESITTASSSGTTINTDTTNRRFSVGRDVLIVSIDADGRISSWEVGTVAALAAGAITLESALAGTFATRSAVFPLMVTEVALTNPVKLSTDRVSDAALTFIERYDESIEPEADPDLGAGTDSGVYGTQSSDANGAASAPILAIDPQWTQDVLLEVVRAGESFAQGRGTVVTTRGGRPQLKIDFGFEPTSKADSYGLIKFFDHRRGRLLPFWLVNPGTLWNPIAITTTYLDVAASGTLADVESFLPFIAVVLKAGTIYIRQVQSVVVNAGNWRITFATALPSLLLVNVRRATSAHFVRFASDELAEEWTTRNVSKFSVSVQEILAEQTVDAPVFPPCGMRFCTVIYAAWVDKVNEDNPVWITSAQIPEGEFTGTIELPLNEDPDAFFADSTVVPAYTFTMPTEFHKHWTIAFEDSSIAIYTIFERVPIIGDSCDIPDPGPIDITKLPKTSELIVLVPPPRTLPTVFRRARSITACWGVAMAWFKLSEPPNPGFPLQHYPIVTQVQGGIWGLPGQESGKDYPALGGNPLSASPAAQATVLGPVGVIRNDTAWQKIYDDGDLYVFSKFCKITTSTAPCTDVVDAPAVCLGAINSGLAGTAAACLGDLAVDQADLITSLGIDLIIDSAAYAIDQSAPCQVFVGDPSFLFC